MGGSSQAKEHPFEYFFASGLSAMINYPLWRASAIGQSGFRVNPTTAFQGILKRSNPYVPVFGRTLLSGIATNTPPFLLPYVHAFAPPYKGMMATILGMTWARAAIFWGSDRGKEMLEVHFPKDSGEIMLHPSVYALGPPLVVSIFVQCVNQPLVRASITVQNPESELPNVKSAVRMIYEKYGLKGLWHGTVSLFFI